MGLSPGEETPDCGGPQLRIRATTKEKPRPILYIHHIVLSISTSVSVKYLISLQIQCHLLTLFHPRTHTNIRLLPTEKNPLPEVPLPWRCGLVKGPNGYAANRITNIIHPDRVILRELTIEGYPVDTSCNKSRNTPLLRRLPSPPTSALGFGNCVQVHLAARRAYCTQIPLEPSFHWDTNQPSAKHPNNINPIHAVVQYSARKMIGSKSRKNLRWRQ